MEEILCSQEEIQVSCPIEEIHCPQEKVLVVAVASGIIRKLSFIHFIYCPQEKVLLVAIAD